jgi:hypothetical protein
MSQHLETSKLLFEAVKVMIPVLTGFLTVYAVGIGKLWDRRNTPVQRFDLMWLAVISSLAFLSFGFWALTMAGAIVSTSGKAGLTIPFSIEQALPVARISMGVGYWFFVFTLFSSAYYFLKLNINIRANKSMQPNAKASAD